MTSSTIATTGPAAGAAPGVDAAALHTLAQRAERLAEAIEAARLQLAPHERTWRYEDAAQDTRLVAHNLHRAAAELTETRADQEMRDPA